MYQHTKERGSFLKLFTRWTFLGKEQTFYRDLLSSYIDYTIESLYISPQSQHADACWAWFKYLSSDASGFQSGFPARRSVVQSEAFIQQSPPGMLDVYNAYADASIAAQEDINNTLPEPEETMIDRFWFYRAVDRAIQGKDLERELTDAQRITEAHLSCIRGGGDRATCATQVDPTYSGFGS
jgi:hypothetical protein